MLRHALLAALIAAPLGQSAQAQVATALLRENDPLPGAAAGQVITHVDSVVVNRVGGFAARVRTDDGSTPLDHIWGSADGTTPTILRSVSTVGPHQQTAFDRALGLADIGSVAYSATGIGGSQGTFDSVFLDEAPVAVTGEAHPTLPGMYWTFVDDPGLSSGGLPYFVAGLSRTPGGPTINHGLFKTIDGGGVLLLGGRLQPNLPRPLWTDSTVRFDTEFSSDGSHYITRVRMEPETFPDPTNDAIVVDGWGLMVDGQLVQEGMQIPESIGGLPGELWKSFLYMGINDAGNYYFAGGTQGGPTPGGVLVVDGQVRYRGGSVIAGKTLLAVNTPASINEEGELAIRSAYDDGGVSRVAIFFEDHFVIDQTSEVDWDGDGVIDEGCTITSLQEIALASDDRIYFTATVNCPSEGADLEALLVVETPVEATPFCFGDGSTTACPCSNGGAAGEGCGNSSGPGGRLDASGYAVVGQDSFTLQASQLPSGVPGLFFQGDGTPQSPPLFGDGLLCATQQVVRLQVVVADGGGSAASSILLSERGGVNPGEPHTYQYWYRDNSGPCGGGFNTTNALSIDWQ